MQHHTIPWVPAHSTWANKRNMSKGSKASKHKCRKTWGRPNSSRGKVHHSCCLLLSFVSCFWCNWAMLATAIQGKPVQEPGSSTGTRMSILFSCEAAPTPGSTAQVMPRTLSRQRAGGRKELSYMGTSQAMTPALRLFDVPVLAEDASAMCRALLVREGALQPITLLPLAPEPLASLAWRRENAHLNIYEEANKMSPTF